MQSSYFYAGVIGLASGIFFRSFFVLSTEALLLVGLMAFMFLSVARISRRGTPSLFSIVGIFLLMVCAGSVRMSLAESESSLLIGGSGQSVVLQGVVAREPDRREKTTHLYIRDDATGELFLAYHDPYSEVAYGDEVQVEGQLTLPESFEGEGGRVFNYPGFLKARGVEVVMFPESVEVLRTGGGNILFRSLYEFKHFFLAVLEELILEPAVGLGEGMLLGVRRALGEDLEDIFRSVGIIHIVVLSGYNIMIVADFIMRILRRFTRPSVELACGILGITLFALLVGLSATVLRASIMAVLVLVARHIGRTYAMARALSVAGVCMLMHNPYLLAFDPGFQLSFLATLGLVLLSEPFESRFTLVPEWMRGHLATTLSTQLFVLPLLIFQMGTVSLIAVIANLLVLPVVPYAMLLTFLTGLVGMVSGVLGTLVGYIAYLILEYIIQIATLLSRVPYAEVTVAPISPVLLALLYGSLFLFVVFISQKGVKKKRNIRHVSVTPKPVVNDYEGWVIEEKKENQKE